MLVLFAVNFQIAVSVICGKIISELHQKDTDIVGYVCSFAVNNTGERYGFV